MSILTTATRMWLTRSLNPFVFKNEYDNILPYTDAERLGLYIHIPFCESLCPFCPYCKEKLEKERCEEYIDHLISEIHLVGNQNDGKKVASSLYFGGGTPALAIDRIQDIVEALNEHFVITEGIGLELHPDNVTPENLAKLKKAGVTKISIGIQSFQAGLLKTLGRGETDFERVFKVLREGEFETVSMDFIFALPGQTFEDLKSDIETAFSNGANHVAIYPFIDFTFTESEIAPMGKREKRKLLDQITMHCENKGFIEIRYGHFQKIHMRDI